MVITPSIHSLFTTGIILLFIFIIFIMNLKKIINLPFYQKLILFSTICIALGIHGLIHLGVETTYHFNYFNYNIPFIYKI